MIFIYYHLLLCATSILYFSYQLLILYLWYPHHFNLNNILNHTPRK